MNDGEVALFEERGEAGHGGVEAEAGIEGVGRRLGWMAMVGRMAVVVRVLVGDDDVEAVGGAALEDDDELAVAGRGRR